VQRAQGDFGSRIMTWRFIRWHGCKGQFVPQTLFGQLEADMRKRLAQHDPPEELSVDFDDCDREAEEAAIDLPGMIRMDRGWWSCDIDVGRVAFPVLNVRDLRRQLVSLPLRTFNDGTEYYKLHGWLVCLVLTPEQRDSILQALADDWDAIEAREDKELDQWRETVRVLNSHPNISVTGGFPPAMLGPARVDKKGWS